MTSCDTNVLFPACDSASPRHDAACAFLAGHAEHDDFCLCEQVLMELYCLLRNPTVCQRPLSGPEAAAVVRGFRSNPHWSVVDVVGGSNIMRLVWTYAAGPAFGYRRIFDARLAATLRHHGVRQFATRNLKDFTTFGFERVWDPFTE